MIHHSARWAGRILLVAAVVAFGQTKSILVIRPAGTNFEEARKGIGETLGATFVLQDVVVGKETTSDDVAKIWKTAAPKLVVVMDNRSIALFREVREKNGDTAVPAVAIMGVRVDAAINGLRNSVGINYEIPAVTTLINLRSILKTPVAKAAMVYRASWEDMFERNAKFCKGENIELVGKKIPDGSDPAAGLDAALKELSKDPSIDALVVINDNFFLNVSLLKKVWLPGLSGWKRPVIVGVESLVKPELKFGNFAILPDHYALGSQAAGLIQELEDAQWKVDDAKTDQPLSVIKVLNLRGMSDCCKVRDDKKSEIDKVLD